MKISLENLKKIIEEELQFVIDESIKKKIEDAIPTIMKNDVATKIYKVARKGVQKRQISLNDFFSVAKGLERAIATKDKDFAEKAVSQNTALKKLGLDVIIGDITNKVPDNSISGTSGGSYPKSLSGDSVDFGKTYGAKLVLSL